MKTTLLMTALVAGFSVANAAVLLSTNFTGSGASGAVTWNTQDPAITTVDSTLNAVGGPFAILGNESTANDLTINDNLNDDTAKGFEFQFTLASAFQLDQLLIDTGHLNSVGGDQAFDSDLVLTISGGSLGSPIVKSLNVEYGVPGSAARLPQLIDLTGESLDAGVYNLQLHMIDSDNGVGGAFATYDNFSLEGSAVPEPSSAALLGLGSLALLLRRRS